MKILMFSTHSMKYIWYSPQKSKYPLSILTLVSVIKSEASPSDPNITRFNGLVREPVESPSDAGKDLEKQNETNLQGKYTHPIGGNRKR